MTQMLSKDKQKALLIHRPGLTIKIMAAFRYRQFPSEGYMEYRRIQMN
jgi:hypothetical protein